MDLQQLVALVTRMRDCQKRYFKHREQSALRESKELERRVDDACKAILAPKVIQQNSMFEDEP